MTYWPWWLGGLALAGVALVNWFLQQRMMAVSGRFTALVNRMRLGAQPEPELDMTSEEMLAALRDVTAAEFGAGSMDEPPAQTSSGAVPSPLAPQSTATHGLFFAAVAGGAFASTALAGVFHVDFGLRSELLPQLVGGSRVLEAVVLLFGGALVGFGTRMAGGCTSGHGLCGTSRLQPGSLLATVAFFGTGVATAMLLRGLL